MISDWLTSGGYRGNKWKKRLKMVMDPSYIPKRMFNKFVQKLKNKFMWR